MHKSKRKVFHSSLIKFSKLLFFGVDACAALKLSSYGVFKRCEQATSFVLTCIEFLRSNNQRVVVWEYYWCILADL